MDQVRKYFNTEKYESVFFIVVGLVAIVIAGYFLAIIKQPFKTGMAYSLMGIAFIQIVVGSTVYVRSPKDIERVENLIANDKIKISFEEIPRMNVVMRNFEIYKYMEISLIATGIFFFSFLSDELFNGVGLGLVIQAALMLILDFVAASRGAEYLKFLESLN